MKKILITFLALALIVLLGFVGIKLTTKETETIMNSGFVNGNTASNLYNGGAFCEYDGTIYFSNPSDSWKLYLAKEMKVAGYNIDLNNLV